MSQRTVYTCDFCQKEVDPQSTIYLSLEIKSKFFNTRKFDRNVDICEDCAKEKGLILPTSQIPMIKRVES